MCNYVTVGFVLNHIRSLNTEPSGLTRGVDSLEIHCTSGANLARDNRLLWLVFLRSSMQMLGQNFKLEHGLSLSNSIHQIIH